MYLRENRSLFLDPFGATKDQISRCKDLTRSLVRRQTQLLGDGHARAWIIPNSRTQHHAKVQYPVDQAGVASMRFDMAMSLVKNSDDLFHCVGPVELSSGLTRLTNGLSALAVPNGTTTCVGTPSISLDYYCKACTL
ncbi:hypothetical protein F7725_000105 [Dissostichus mawsoni]|uniref:Uncharacterized protein n=1 Tax=Dissostichus mawsoni TaxID=36200 RepID=A0A7J5ZE30_DISMA|nr:hypothetical protein F7725_000105 [Dissostichus mawsoni]